MSEFTIEGLPDELKAILATLPPNVNRRTGAELVTRHMFPVSHRTLESWPLPTRHVNGQAVIPTAALFGLAHAKLSAAPLIMGGASRRSGLRSRPANQTARTYPHRAAEIAAEDHHPHT